MRSGDCTGNPTQNSWTICHGGHQHRCADWFDGKGRKCICRGTYERQCGSTPHSCQTGTDADYIAILTQTAAKGTPTLAALTQTSIFFDCGVSGGADVIPQQETDLVVAAESIVDDVDNLIDDRTSPDNYFGVNGLLCMKLNICMCGPDCV